jgi:hypothetical protein
MAQIDPNIAMGFRPVQIPLEESPLNRMQKYADFENALVKSQELQRSAQQRNALSRIRASGLDIESPEYLTRVSQEAPDLADVETERQLKRLQLREAKQTADLKQSQLTREQLRTAKKELLALPNLDAALKDIYDGVQSGVLTAEQGEALRAGLPTDEAEFPKWQQKQLLGYLTVEQQLSRAEPKIEKVDIGGAIKFIDVNPNSSTYNQEVGPKSITKTAAPVAPSKVVQLQGELDTAKKTYGVNSPQAKQIQNEIEQETGGLERQRIGQDAKRLQLEARRVDIDQKRQALAEQNAKRDADPAFQQRMAAARATGEATAKDEVKARQTLPGVILRGEEGVRLIDSLVGKAPVKDKNGKVVEKGTAPHPGFETAVGATWLPGSRFVPGTDAADFQARFEQLKGASFLEAFETLKGGGAITNIEGEKGTAAINRMALAQSEKEFVDAARDVQRIMNAGIKRARTRASMPQSGTSTAPPTGYVLDK